MATRIRVTRVHNPRRSYRRTRANRRRRATHARRSYRNRRRNMTDKQIRHFGTKAQRAALKRRNRGRRTYRKSAVRASNRRRTHRRRRRNIAAGFYDEEGYFHPIRASYDYSRKRAGERAPKRKRKTAKRSRKRTKSKRTRRRNPTLLEFGTLNPRGGGHRRRTYKRRKTNVAKRRTRRSSNRRRHNRRRSYRRSPLMRTRRRRTYHRRRARRNPRHTYRSRRRNPVIFGQSSAKEIAFMIAGGLVGVAAVKYLPTLMPSGLTSSLGAGGGIMQVGITVAGAFVAGWVGGMWDRSFGDAVLFGGLMQAGSQLLSMFLNPNPLALSGLGDIIATRGFVVPQNPVLQPMAVAAPSKGMGAFRGAFGYRR